MPSMSHLEQRKHCEKNSSNNFNLIKIVCVDDCMLFFIHEATHVVTVALHLFTDRSWGHSISIAAIFQRVSEGGVKNCEVTMAMTKTTSIHQRWESNCAVHIDIQAWR